MTPITATVEEFRRGTWVADTVTTEVPTGSFDFGGVSWVGTPVGQSTLDGARYRSRIVGGKGRLSVELPEKNYSGSISFALIASAIIAEAGEAAGTITAPGRVSYYERARGTAGEALAVLCDAGALTWWVGRDGRVNVSAERPTVAEIDLTVTPQLGTDVDGSFRLNVEDVNTVQPSMQLPSGQMIRHIRWQHDTKLTADCSPTQPVPLLSKDFYLKTYDAKVDKQNGDGSIDVIVGGIFSMSRVPLLNGLPGARVIVKPGESVTVGFLGGSRSAPYAIGNQPGSDAAKAAALNGDTVTILLPPFAFTGTVGGVPATGVMVALTGQTLGTITGPSSQRVKLD